jgi:hypothetical protein
MYDIIHITIGADSIQLSSFRMAWHLLYPNSMIWASGLVYIHQLEHLHVQNILDRLAMKRRMQTSGPAGGKALLLSLINVC